MSDTREEILQLGEKFIRTRGYHAFSYSDISHELNIKNAAVHYHFASKEDLGVAIIQKSINLFHEMEGKWIDLTCKDQLLDFIQIYEKSKANNWSCLVGALSSSSDALPKRMKERLSSMAEYILDRLTLALQKGLENGEFIFSENPRAKAQLIISSLLSSLLLDKVVKEDIFNSIVQSIIQSVESHK